jgi:hypothetical protein
MISFVCVCVCVRRLSFRIVSIEYNIKNNMNNYGNKTATIPYLPTYLLTYVARVLTTSSWSSSSFHSLPLVQPYLIATFACSFERNF